jgi:protein phosphatase
MIPTDRPHLTFAAASHPGEARQNNEDRYRVSSYLTERGKQPVLLALVADGIGGHQAGEVASQIAVDETFRILEGADASNPLTQLQEAIVTAGRAISQAAGREADLHGMGSTIAVAWIIDHQLFTTHVGDSRIYLLREGGLRQVSVDHTWVQEAVAHGILTPEEAIDHPNAHVLHRHLGGDRDAEPDFRLRLTSEEPDERSEANQGLRMHDGDQVLLCSDGLTDMVSDTEIQGALTNNPPAEAVEQLIALARARGGFDNITIVAIAVPSQRVRARGCLGTTVRLSTAVLLLLGLIAAGLGAAYWMGFWPWARQPEGAGSSTGPDTTPAALAPAGPAPGAGSVELPPLPSATPTPAPSPSGPTPTPVG